MGSRSTQKIDVQDDDSLEQKECRKVDRILYGLAELAIEEWLKNKGSKNPVRELTESRSYAKMDV